MKITFEKYQGAGNDFILLDNRTHTLPKDAVFIQKICDRHFGVGADGVIYLENCSEAHFKMDYYNSDGSASFCGNGARCALAFAEHLSIFKQQVNFLASDGLHLGKSLGGNIFSLAMQEVTPEKIQNFPEGIFVHTGAPHLVVFCEHLDSLDILQLAPSLRQKYNANINFCQKINENWHIRTFERGVENETLACGTGATALAVVLGMQFALEKVDIFAKGGLLQVALKQTANLHFQDIWLTGEAKQVFNGMFDFVKNR
jgi:diaminopimelate epimerase